MTSFVKRFTIYWYFGQYSLLTKAFYKICHIYPLNDAVVAETAIRGSNWAIWSLANFRSLEDPLYLSEQYLPPESNIKIVSTILSILKLKGPLPSFSELSTQLARWKQRMHGTRRRKRFAVQPNSQQKIISDYHKCTLKKFWFSCWLRCHNIQFRC